MNSNKIFVMIILCMTFWLIYYPSSLGQTKQQIRLLDEESTLPITGATFEYGGQNGITDQEGTISFRLVEDEVMTISHLNYGSWQWSEEVLKELVQSEIYFRRSSIRDLYPVTVIAVRSNHRPDDRINIDYQDRMEHDGAALLKRMPSIGGIRKGGNYGFDPVFRGFKYDQLNIVMNGAQSATAACPNRMDPPTSQMAPNMLEKIEVLKGPHALRYGTGFGGTINFISSKLRFTNESDIYGRFSTEFKSNGSGISSEGQIGFSGSHHDLNLFAAWSQGDDYKAGNGQSVKAGFQRGSFGSNLGLKLSSRQQLRISALYNMARDADFPALPMDLREDDTWMFNARHDAIISREKLKSWNTAVFGSFVDHLMDNLLKPLNPRLLNASTNATTYNYGGRTEGAWSFSNGSLFAGADLRIEGADGIREREFVQGPNAGKILKDNAWQNGHISKTGIFGEYHFNTGRFKYVISARIEMNASDLDAPADEFTSVHAKTQVTQLNPNLSLGISKNIGAEVNTGLWLGRAQRSGSLTERFINYFPVGQDPYEMLGNPELKPEVNNQVDMTFEWKTDRTILDIDIFASYLQNYISSVIDTTLSARLPTSPGVRQFVNIENAFKSGFEINWIQDLAAGMQHQMGIAYTYAQDLTNSEPLPEVAPLDFQYTLHGKYLEGRLQPEVTFRHVLKQSRISMEYGESVTPSFSLLDLKLGFKLSDKIRVSSGINNLFDQHYYEHLNRSVRGSNDFIFERGRNFYGSLSISFD